MNRPGATSVMDLLKRKHVQIEISIEPDDTEVATAFEDMSQAQYVFDDIESGNAWAWVLVTVTLTVWMPNGQLLLKNEQYLGACNYKDEDDFKAGGYYEDMLAEGLNELNEELECVLNQVAGLSRWLVCARRF
jgi:hypothetical protein